MAYKGLYQELQTVCAQSQRVNIVCFMVKKKKKKKKTALHLNYLLKAAADKI